MLLNLSSLNAELESTALEKWQALASAEDELNHIHFLTDDTGACYESHKAVEDHCVDFFSNFMGSPH